MINLPFTITILIIGGIALTLLWIVNRKYQRTSKEKAILEERTTTQLSEIGLLRQRNCDDEATINVLRSTITSNASAVGKLTGERESLVKDKNELRFSLNEKTNEAEKAARLIGELEEKLANQIELYNQQKEDLLQMTEKLKKDFSLLANEILEAKTEKFNENQQKELNALLEPLKTNLSEFKKQVEQTYKSENEDRISLREQVKQMMDLNGVLSKEAKALTLALSGSTKKQGDWGEFILESILDYCGLQKNIHYFTQESSEDGEGRRIRPDVVVKYPSDRSVVIDSKVSLNAYEQLCREENPERQALLIKGLLQSIYAHIDGLSAKDYTQVANSLDMVIMFLPVEAAYITALQNDPGIQQYAYKKNVLFVSASNLTIAMKLIYDMWKRDAINKNAEAVAERAGKLYDKLAGFVENFERIGKAIGNLQIVYGEAHKQLASGKGNILVQAEQMKELKIKSAKQIPPKFINEAAAEELLLGESDKE